MRIGVFGGTFDPPHMGHLQAAKSAADQLGLDKLLLIPNAQPPHKSVSQSSPPGEVRLEMTELAVKPHPFFEVSDIEIRRGGKSYTVDTVAELKLRYPGSEIYLFMGTDMLLYIEKWRAFEKLLQEAVLAVFPRSAGETEQIRSYSEYLKKEYGARIMIVENEAIQISSSALREMLPKREGRAYLDDEVYAYIVKHRLYGAKPDFNWLRERAYSMLKAKRIPHVKGCEEEAVRLAGRWGADEELAREAAILHDITKKCDLTEQLILCEKYGIIIDNVEKREAKLLHAKTGAAIAKYEFGASDEVFSAIFWHTTGRTGMTLLEKIVYMADYIEPTRHFDGVEELRRLAYEDLDEALELGLDMSITDMLQRGIVPHEYTLEALNWVKEVLAQRKN